MIVAHLQYKTRQDKVSFKYLSDDTVSYYGGWTGWVTNLYTLLALTKNVSDL